jgi:23S rRNA pseudouridine1911/1915/1917 synthase
LPETLLSKVFTLFYEDKEILIVCKARGVPTASARSSRFNNNLVRSVFEYCPSVAQVRGYRADDGGLLHRIDNDTEGLVLFAKTQESFNFLLNEAKANRFVKYYRAHAQISAPLLPYDAVSLTQWQYILDKNIFANSFYSLTTRFVKAEARSAKVRAVGKKSRSAKATRCYHTQFLLNSQGNIVNIYCKLRRGFRHQVRASLAAVGLPIIGDPLYGNNSKPAANFAFWAVGLSFRHPHSTKPVSYFYNPLNTNNQEKPLLSE